MAGFRIQVSGYRKTHGSGFPVVLRMDGGRIDRQIVFSLREGPPGQDPDELIIALDDLRAAVVAFSSYDRAIEIGERKP